MGLTRWTSWLLAVGGPLVLGATLGVRFGIHKIVTEAAVLAGLMLGLTIMMAPALYIGLSLVGAAPPAARLAESVGSALRASGTVMAGLAPATAFLLSTTLSHVVVYILGVVAVAGAALAGLRALWLELDASPGTRLRALGVFGIWSLVSTGLGAHLFVSSLGA